MVHHPERSEQESKPGYRIQWFFHEFWPILLFGSFFVIMCALPLILSSQFAAMRDFSTSDIVWGPYGLLIIGAFLVAILLTFFAPRLLAWYLFLLGVLALVLAEGTAAFRVGASVAIVFLGFVLFGIFVLPQKRNK